MKTDRELLELAAKAAGIGPIIRFEGDGLIIGPNRHSRYWNPLDDDGQSLRLLSQLEMGIQLSGSGIVTVWWNQGTLGIGQDYSELGLIVGIRRAIVRAAAFIGESMP